MTDPMFSKQDLRKLIFPLVVEQILSMLVGMVDTVMVSYAGETAISGVALVTELVRLISSDAGNQSLGKAMQILGDCVILFLSLPMFEGFFATIRDMMGFI